MKRGFFGFVVLTGLLLSGASEAQMVTWSDPSTDPHAPGGKISIMEGSFTQSGRLVFLVSYPPHYVAQTYFHDVPVEILVMQGQIMTGGNDGSAPDLSKGVAHSSATKYTLPAKTPQWLASGDDGAIVQVIMEGPFSLHWVK